LKKLELHLGKYGDNASLGVLHVSCCATLLPIS